jgi:D-serine deaminase-like pyridoxal phosphate-dependent protein
VLNPDLAGFKDIETPALVLDRAALMRNIAAMAATAMAAGIALRPHAKTHKSAEIARLQIAAGAIGICCATVAEIEALARANIPGLMLTTPVMDRPKLIRLAAIARDADIAIVIDHADQIAVLDELIVPGARPLDLLVDIDVGQRRTGVIDAAQTVMLARLIATKPWARFAGIQGFAGHVQHIIDAAARKAAAASVGAILNAHLAALREAGIAAAVVTGSGTGASSFDAAGPYTELQVGSYVFMDADYGKLTIEAGGALPFEASLYVLATVTSVNRPGEFTIDAGVKALAFNGPPPDRIIGAPDGCTYRFGGDEHGMVTLPDGAAAPKLGSRVLVLTTHCDPTVNLHPRVYAVGTDGGIEIWPVLARYGA